MSATLSCVVSLSCGPGPLMWTTMSRDDGHRLLHLLIRYIVDRRDHENRWVQALEKTDVPLNFVWGMRDPISGAHMAERIRARLPHAPLEALHDVGHWPPLEAPSARPRLSGRTEQRQLPSQARARPRNRPADSLRCGHPVAIRALSCRDECVRGRRPRPGLWRWLGFGHRSGGLASARKSGARSPTSPRLQTCRRAPHRRVLPRRVTHLQQLPARLPSAHRALSNNARPSFGST